MSRTCRMLPKCQDQPVRAGGRWLLPRRACSLLLAGAFAAAVVLPGCNILGPAGYFILGPEKQPAAYTLDREQVGVIVIDDKANVVPHRSLRELIGRTAEEEILAQKLMKDMVKSSLALAVLSRERFGEKQTIAEIGQALKADVVIYATVDDFSLTQDQQSVTPMAKLRVKVVSVKTGERLFPDKDQTEPFPLSIRLPAQAMDKPTGAAILQNQQELARLTGLALARMFYEHIPSKPGRLKEIR